MPDGSVGFSVLMPTYRGDDPDHLEAAIASVFDQTVPPTEFLIVKDGPVGDPIESVLSEWKARHPETIRTVTLDTNQGLGKALQVGVEACSHDLIARLDADDVCVPDRFERQLAYFEQNPNCDVVGGYIAEFAQDPDETYAVRDVPLEPGAVREWAPRRCPVNHVSVMFRRNAVLEAGNYRPVEPQEDYDLWARLLLDGAVIANVPAILVKVRAGEELYDRRGGFEYAYEEVRRQIEFRRQGFIGTTTLIRNMVVRVPIRLLPGAARGLVYRRLLRRNT